MLGILGVSLYISCLRPSVLVFHINGVNIGLWHKTAVSLSCEAQGNKIGEVAYSPTRYFLDMFCCFNCILILALTCELN